MQTQNQKDHNGAAKTAAQTQHAKPANADPIVPTPAAEPIKLPEAPVVVKIPDVVPPQAAKGNDEVMSAGKGA